MLDQEDEGTRIGVWVALGVVFFVLVAVVGGLVLRQMQDRPAPVPAAAAGEALLDAPLAGELIAKVYFDSGVATLPADAASAVAGGTQALLEQPARRIVLSGFHDTTGDAAKNAELARQRAVAVRQALLAAGADAGRVLLRRPESTSGDGSLQEARRVELRLVD